MNKNKVNNLNEDPEFGLDSRYLLTAECNSEATLLMAARLDRMKSLSLKDIYRVKLMKSKLEKKM
jgi:hypothetical protein